MEIKNITSAVNAYRYSAESVVPSAKKTVDKKEKNTDKADFSSKVSFADSLRTAAKAAAESSASPERLSALAAKIADGSYNIPAEDVASAILGM